MLSIVGNPYSTPTKKTESNISYSWCLRRVTSFLLSQNSHFFKKKNLDSSNIYISIFATTVYFCMYIWNLLYFMHITWVPHVSINLLKHSSLLPGKLICLIKFTFCALQTSLVLTGMEWFWQKYKQLKKTELKWKNNRRSNCRLQLWVVLVLIVFKETEMILCALKNYSVCW